MKLVFRNVLLVAIVATLVASTTSTATVYASSHKKSSDSSASSGSNGADSSGGSGSGSTTGPGSSGSQSSGSGSTLPPSGSTSGQSSGTTGPNPSGPPPPPPGQPQSLTTCPNGGQPDSSGKCPSIPPPPTEKCPGGAQPDKNGNCPPPLPICLKGEVLINGKCVPLGPCHLADNGTKIHCPGGGGHTTVIERNTVQQIPLTTNVNDINLFIVTTCTADQNNGVLSGNLAALCDSTITMMHDDGLNTQLPQVDLYLKARGLLQ